MAKKIIVIILGILNVVLLTIIIISAATGWRIGGNVPVQSAVSNEPSQAESSLPPAMSNEPSQAESSLPPVVSNEPSQLESSLPPAVSNEPSSQEIPDGNSMSTSGYPSVGDIIYFDIHNGWTGLSPNAVMISEAYQTIGGWKAYLVLDPQQKAGINMQKFANINIGFGQSGMAVTIDWYRTFSGDLMSGSPDNAPDSAFTGEWSGGAIDAVGSGRIRLHSFCYDQGREYATGSMILPDGTEAVIAMIRP